VRATRAGPGADRHGITGYRTEPSRRQRRLRKAEFRWVLSHVCPAASQLWLRQDRFGKQWAENTPKTSGFALADVVPPSIAPNAIFRSTPRELFGRVVQTLTGHGFTGEYYQRFVPTESPWCACSDEVTDPTLQTRQHIILCECPRYEAYRNILRRNHPDLHAHNFSLRHLFDPRNGLPDLILFMHRSGAPRPDPKPD